MHGYLTFVWNARPCGISIGSAVFAGLTCVTDRQSDRLTDHATRSLTIGRIYLRSTAMRPNNNNNNNNNLPRLCQRPLDASQPSVIATQRFYTLVQAYRLVGFKLRVGITDITTRDKPRTPNSPCNTPFTRYNRLLKRFDNRLYRVNGA